MSGRAEARSFDSGPLRDVFGFGLDEAEWFEKLRRSSVPESESPRWLGEYELLEAVGRGGQGIVYRARQPRTGREIVLKRLSAGVFATVEMHARFAREVEAAAALDHPNIVTVFGSEIIDGQPVLAMQWIDGVSFDLWAAASEDDRGGGRRPLTEILRVFARVCAAVHHAHQRGVIHRDLKPSNILVDRENEPHVLDFGLAKLRTSSVADPLLTHSGMFVGTLAYAAPEQALGRHREVDVRTDVYSLGAVLYAAVCGTMAFEPSQDVAALLHDIQHRDPQLPSVHDPRIGREVDAIVLKALAKEKTQRYASVEALGADVERYLSGQAVLAHPPSTSYRVRKLVRQHKVASAFALLLVAAATVSTVLYLQAESARRDTGLALQAESRRLVEANEQRARAEREWNRARGAEVLLADLLDKALRGAQGGVPVVTVREVMDLISADMEQSTQEYLPEVEAWMRMSLGNAYAGLGLSVQARRHFERALELRRGLFGDDGLDVAESMEKLGRACRVLGDLAAADRCLEGALVIRRRLLTGDDGYFANNMNSLGILKRHLRKYEEAEAWLVESLGIYVRALGPKNESVPVVMKNLGLVYLDMRRPEDAEELMREALPLALELHGELHVDVASIRLNLGTALCALERYDEAEAMLERAIATAIALYGDRNGTLGLAQERLAEVYRKTARQHEAVSLLDLALESHLAARHPTDSIRCLDARGRLLQEIGNLAEAEVSFREALCIACESYEPDHELVARSQASLAALLIERGQ